MFSCKCVDDLWATKSEGDGLIVRAVSFQDFQPLWSWFTNVTDRRTDSERYAISIPRDSLRAMHYSASRGNKREGEIIRNDENARSFAYKRKLFSVW